jgi:IMP dehydrogenase
LDVQLGIERPARMAYGFDDVSIVPNRFSVEPELVDLSFRLGDHELGIPVVSSAMDAATGPELVGELARLGGLGVVNLEGVFGRYDDPAGVIQEIRNAPAQDAVATIQKVYAAPVKDEFVSETVEGLSKLGVLFGVSSIPASAERLAPIAREARAPIFVVQSTVTTAVHEAKNYEPLDMAEFCRTCGMTVVVGNCVAYEATLDLMRTGAAGVLIGVGPGYACTSRRVLGIGVPQITATVDAAAARAAYEKETGRHIAVITDGGMRCGGDVSKAIAAGADAVMLGTPISSSSESPGRGYNWGMATTSAELPRGARVKSEMLGSLEEILFGPTDRNDGTMNLVGALRLAMATCGAKTIGEMQQAELVIAPAVATEGKALQMKGV